MGAPVIALNIGCATNLFPAPWLNIDAVDMEDAYFRHIRHLDAERLDSGWSDEQKGHVRWLNAGTLRFEQRDLRKGFPDYADGTVDAIYGGQMIEHLQPHTEAPAFLAECYRMLKPGGRIKLTTPDLVLLIEHFLSDSMATFEADQPAFYRGALEEDQLAFIMYGAGGTAERYEGHQHLYTERSLLQRLAVAGFRRADSNSTVFADCIDKGMTHSFALEAVK
jgi:predicted SAM-dependent methyltransferase